MSDAAIVVLGAARVTPEGVPLIQAVQPVTNSKDDIEPLGDAEVFQCLGVTSIPWPATKEGHAEGFAILNVGGRDAVLVGARDVRTAKIVGKMKPGDTVVHSTGPQQASQLQLKEKERLAVLATKDSKGETMLAILDGKNDEAQIICGGNVFKMSRKGGVIISDASGKGGIHIQDGTVRILGTLMLPCSVPVPAFKLMMGPATGSPGGPASVPLLAVPGVVCGQ